MALQALYKQFLAAPDLSLLAADATLHYVTTTTSYKSPADIIKHLNTQRNQVKKKKEELLTVIEGQNAAAIEVDTTIEFVTSGGPYLPGLDDNFLSDRTVHLAITHIITFSNDGKIVQIRQSWDQGSLLKQLDVIGRTGRNWPIRDSQEQIKLIANCSKALGDAVSTTDADMSTRGRGISAGAPLTLFAPREETESETLASVISPKGGARPRQRGFVEILGDEPDDVVGSPSAGRERSLSPSKVIAPKLGAGKNFQPSRLFDTEEGHEVPDSPEGVKSPPRRYRPNPTKFDHFDFADGPEGHDAPTAANANVKASKHGSQWSFEDFVTPAKVKPTRVLQKSHQDVRHWGVEEDPVQESPVRKPVVPKPRRDAEPHFEFIDDGPQGERRTTRPRGVTHNNTSGLYKNNVYSEEGEEPKDGPDDQALGNITNLKDRGKTFNPQFAMADDSPSQDSKGDKPNISQDRMKSVKMMDANWSTFDTSPAQKENQPKPAAAKGGKSRGIHIGGDGMGGSKDSNRDWLFGEEDGATVQAAPTRKQGTAAQSGGFNWDF